MPTHSFDTEIAEEVGVNAAVVFQHIQFWIIKNAANGEREKHFHEGKWWTYQSARGLALLFPYMSEEQVRRAVEKLVDVGLIGTGNFNPSAYDRTKWFCLLRQIHLAKLPNGSGENAGPIPDRNPDRRTDRNLPLFDADASPSPSPSAPPQPKSNDLDQSFDEFWSAYPKRVEKKAARAKFAAAVKGGADPERIVAAAAAYARSENVRRGFAKHPTTWLNAGCWEDELPGGPRPAGAPDPRQAQIESLLKEAETLERVGFPGMAESKRGEAERLRRAVG